MTCPLCGLPLDPFRNTIVRLMDQPPYHATCPEPQSGESRGPPTSSITQQAPRKDPAVSSPDPPSFIVTDISTERAVKDAPPLAEIKRWGPGSEIPSPDPLCEDCEAPMSEHTGPGGTSPWIGCKGFIPRGPKC